MKCNLCGQEYEFSLGHRCRVMQEESKQPMPQPHLVSKLRELIAKGKVGWMDSTDFSHELGYALGGNKVYPDAEDCTKAHPCIAIPDAAYPCTAKRVIVFDADELESLLRLEGQAARSKWCAKYGGLYDGDYCRLCDCELKRPSTCGPSQPELAADDEWWKVAALDVIRHARVDGDVPTWDRWRSCIINGLLGAFNRGQDSMRASQPSPSTPIVPGTAGLSADRVQSVQELVDLLPHGDCTAQHRMADCLRCRITDRLNALLGAAQPAERWTCPDCGYDSMPYPPKDYHICPKCMVEFGNDDRKTTLIEREAQIRKDVLEEAAQLLKYCGYSANLVDEIRALAERPAPAGEVKPAPGSVRRAENEAVRLIALLVNELSGKPAPENRIRLVIQDALDVAQGNEPPSRRRGDVHGTA